MSNRAPDSEEAVEVQRPNTRILKAELQRVFGGHAVMHIASDGDSKALRTCSTGIKSITG